MELVASDSMIDPIAETQNETKENGGRHRLYPESGHRRPNDPSAMGHIRTHAAARIRAIRAIVTELPNGGLCSN